LAQTLKRASRLCLCSKYPKASHSAIQLLSSRVIDTNWFPTL